MERLLPYGFQVCPGASNSCHCISYWVPIFMLQILVRLVKSLKFLMFHLFMPPDFHTKNLLSVFLPFHILVPSCGFLSFAFK